MNNLTPEDIKNIIDKHMDKNFELEKESIKLMMKTVSKIKKEKI
jgi:(2Fe-2S) ferredoxin